MAKASSLIMRNGSDSQLPSQNQVWVVSATNGTTYNIGFDKEFVKKHLFIDPDSLVAQDAKALKIVNKIKRYGAPGETVPVLIDADVLRFLKLKKLVLARTVQGTCSVCGEAETQHARLCATCGHLHKKAWVNGGPCDAPGSGCTCNSWVQARGGLVAKGCPQFTVNNYDQDRTSANKANPFGGAGGACTGTNTVLLMDEIDLTLFKDTLVAAIQNEEAIGWIAGTKKEGQGVPLDFGANSGVAATIKDIDTYQTFSGRAKGRGIRVFIKKSLGSVYTIFHFHDMIP